MKKFGKFVLFTSIVAAGAAAVMYVKKKFVDDPVDEDVFDDEPEDEACDTSEDESCSCCGCHGDDPAAADEDVKEEPAEEETSGTDGEEKQ